MKETFERLAKHLYMRQYKTKRGELSTLYYAVFTDWKGVHRKRPLGSNLVPAKQRLRELESGDTLRVDLDKEKNKDKLFVDWADSYLDSYKNRPSFERNSQHLNLHLKPYFGNRRVCDISRMDLLKYRNYRLNQSIIRGSKTLAGRPPRVSTINRELSLLRTLLKLAKGEKIIDDVPTFHMDSEREFQREPTLPDEQYARLLSNSPLWLQLAIRGARLTMASRGDLLRLTWDDVHREVIRVPGGRKKTHVKQTIVITPRLKMLLDELAAIGKNDAAVSKVLNNKVFFRLSPTPEPLTANALHWAFKVACDATDLGNFHWHDWRHVGITDLHRDGLTTRGAMMQAGHRTPWMHERYIHLQDSDLVDLVKASKAWREPEIETPHR